MRVWTLLFLAALLVAGCSQPSKANGHAVTLGDGSHVELTGGPTAAGKGSIVGVVVDEAIRPVKGANLTIPSEGLKTTSDESGLFRFDDLQPGFYVVAASAPGFLPVQSSADVVADDVARLRLLLPTDASPQAYHTTYTLDGYMEAWTGIGQFALEDLLSNGSGLCNCRVFFTADANVTDLVYEAYWKYTLPDPADQAEFYWVVNDPNGDGYEADYCYSPCVQTFDYQGKGFVPGAETYARLDGPDTAVALQQSFKLFVTLWYNAPAPDGWTVAGAT